MRFFLKQQNIIETTPAIDAVSGDKKDDLLVEVKLYDMTDVLLAGSAVTLTSIGAGTGKYRATIPVLSTVNPADYQIELSAKAGGIVVYYFKGLCPGIIRSSF